MKKKKKKKTPINLDELDGDTNQTAPVVTEKQEENVAVEKEKSKEKTDGNRLADDILTDDFLNMKKKKKKKKQLLDLDAPDAPPVSSLFH